MTKPTLAEFLARVRERWCIEHYAGGQLYSSAARPDIEALLNMVEAIHNEAVYPARSFKELEPGEYIDAVALEKALEELVPEGGA